MNRCWIRQESHEYFFKSKCTENPLKIYFGKYIYIHIYIHIYIYKEYMRR